MDERQVVPTHEGDVGPEPIEIVELEDRIGVDLVDLIVVEEVEQDVLLQAWAKQAGQADDSRGKAFGAEPFEFVAVEAVRAEAEGVDGGRFIDIDGAAEDVDGGDEDQLAGLDGAEHIGEGGEVSAIGLGVGVGLPLLGSGAGANDEVERLTGHVTDRAGVETVGEGGLGEQVAADESRMTNECGAHRA